MNILLILFIIILILQAIIIYASYSVLNRHHIENESFDDILMKFINVNQNFFETSEKIAEKQTEITKGLIEETKEISILKRQLNALQEMIKNNLESNKLVKDAARNVKLGVDELNVSKDIAKSLSEVSGNLKILDKIVNKLVKSVEKLGG